jgi:excisionase family DNA binding protein
MPASSLPDTNMPTPANTQTTNLSAAEQEALSATLLSPIVDALSRVQGELRESLVRDLASMVERALDPMLAARDKPLSLMDLKEVATYMKVSPRTVENLICSNELVPIRIRGVRRFTRSAVDAYLRSSAKTRKKR